MAGESNLKVLLANMEPQLKAGEYVFCTINTSITIDAKEIVFSFTEAEGLTIVITKLLADNLGLYYSYIASWITLNVHSSLEAVGLTAAFSKALADVNISCNVVAAYFHDHIFVAKKNTENAMEALNKLVSANK